MYEFVESFWRYQMKPNVIILILQNSCSKDLLSMQDKQNKGVYSVIETCIVQYVCEIYFHGFDISAK